jgi:hypothetical protein
MMFQKADPDQMLSSGTTFVRIVGGVDVNQTKAASHCSAEATSMVRRRSPRRLAEAKSGNQDHSPKALLWMTFGGMHAGSLEALRVARP